MAGRYGSAGSWGPDDFLIVSLFTITADLGGSEGAGERAAPEPSFLQLN